MSTRTYGGDSRTVFLLIRGALWGLAIGAAHAVLLEVLGLFTGGTAYFTVFIVTLGPALLAAGAILGVLVALLTWAVVARLDHDALQRRRALRSAGSTVFVLGVAGTLLGGFALTELLAQDAGQTGWLAWVIFAALVVLLIGIPLTALALFAAGKVFDTMTLRFPR